MIQREHTHLLLTLLGLLALLLLLAVSVASAESGGWQEGEGVRYRTYRTPAPAYYPGAAAVAAPVIPWIRVAPAGAPHGLTLWLDPSALLVGPWFAGGPLAPGGPSAPAGDGQGDSE